MKKVFLSLLLIGLLTVSLAAQVNFVIGPGAQYSGGLQHPLSLSYHRTMRCVPIGEMWVNIPVGWILSLRPGLMYAQKEFNVTVVYSGRLHRETPGEFKAGWIEMPVLLIAQPVDWFHFGGGGYGAVAAFRKLAYTPITDIIYENHKSSMKMMCCPPPPPPKPKPIPNGDPVLHNYDFDWGFMVVAGIDWKIKCPSWTFKNSIEFGWSRGLGRVLSTYDRHYHNEVLTVAYLLWF